MDNENKLRQRFGQPKHTPLVEKEEKDRTEEKQQRPSIGKTPSGQIFRVPSTHDMVTTLLNPLEPKSVFDLITLGCMTIPCLLWLCLPVSISRYILLGLYLFWRLSYNIGLGLLLKYQSDSCGLVELCHHYRLFDIQLTGQQSWSYWLKRQLSIKMDSDYQFEKVPLEYNTWLLFRQLVDLILMNDFASYFFFVLSWFNWSYSSSSFYFMLGDLLRWTGGLFLILFNIWVKLDAHRVVKDFAWYWGDFFFVIEQSLTFDGVFEMAPHPMYSIGYFGYYGLSLISASYMVLFVSIAAHVLQFAFLILVETPHIEKIYNPRKIQRRQPRMNMTLDDDVKHMMLALDKNAGRDISSSWIRSDMIVFQNLDIFRSTDLVSLMVMVYSILLPLLLPDQMGITAALLQAFIWRVIYSGGLGTLLWAQSTTKFFTRHFVKWGGNQVDAFQNWKSIFNLSLCMTYITFFMACWKSYSLPLDWTYGTTLLRHILGLVFISLHIWTSVSIFEVLGDFGWFYGDFFIDQHRNTLLYTGIYRFLNNPEKIMGHAAFWGMTLITNNWIIYGLALFSQLSNVLFLHYVEGPHMQKLYGDQIRSEAGLTKTLRSAANSLPKTFPEKLQELIKLVPNQQQKQQDNNTIPILQRVEKAIEGTVSSVGDTITAGPHIKNLMIEAKNSMEPPSAPSQQHNTTALSSSSRQLKDCQNADYGIYIQEQWNLGTPIKVDWEIVCSSYEQRKYHQKNWIGIYKTTSTSSKVKNYSKTRDSDIKLDNYGQQMTTISSNGRWHWLNEGKNGREDNESHKEKGTLTFKGSQLPWELGWYECRLHFGTSYRILAISRPFEITVPSVPSIKDTDALSLCVMKSIQHVMGNDVERMPMSMVDSFILTDEEAKRLAYMITVMFDLEFAWQVILIDTSVVKLTKRIQQAQNILSPFSNHSPTSSPETTSSSPILE
ncbi:phospholipid methyltransferase-domain-containing protein [Halteromyces radiatus]|uniref:phospholipid methyltransferase-domain-containing protein n=1 Tax=Halteromyces radiatus TaxID=101107 RepID=UPI00221F6D92|nr:phospholipid methyltransferase-domain-containing protein [Halteromyces radiatus]KAI8097432.1 phospholipid methyltransferase-domain-containing protein [Halteromyces radiatus]